MNTFREFYRKNREIVCYLFAGGLTTLVGLGSYYALVLTVLDPMHALELKAANALSWIAAVLFAYVANRAIVFSPTGKRVIKEAGAFFLSRIGTLLLDMGLMFLLVTLLALNDKVSKLAVQVVIILANYLLSKFFVFRA